MGRLNTPEEREATLRWALGYEAGTASPSHLPTLLALRHAFHSELKSYFALAALSRSKSAPNELVAEAHRVVFRCRVVLEKRLHASATSSCNDPTLWLNQGWFYGASKKQGTSVRMPLASCRPTRLCAGACYAHDVLDAAPLSVVRGAVNGLAARHFQEGSESERKEIMRALQPHSLKAVKAATKEVVLLTGSDWTRRPFIRFSHVGEITAFPCFANALAKQVKELSGGAVDCVVYTRHPSVVDLDPDLWVINFTLDQSSRERKAWIPSYARTVFSAFGGLVDADADVNFLEHHRWSHLAPIGQGRVCPVTAPNVAERTCDAVRCNRCFVRPTGFADPSMGEDE